MVCGLQVQKQFSCNADYPQVCSVHILTFNKIFLQSEGPWPAVKYGILQKQILNAPMAFHGSKTNTSNDLSNVGTRKRCKASEYSMHWVQTIKKEKKTIILI